MKTIELEQGTPEWHAHRAEHDNASDAPAMMGESPYKTRTELLNEYKSGIKPDVDERTERLFLEGHRFEALARPLAEEIIGDDLYPVTGSQGRLSASFDGLTLDESIAFEHKMLNDKLRSAMVEGCTGADLPLHYQIQMEQQCAVSGAKRVLFMASEWAGEVLVEERHCWYEPNPALRKKIIAGWAQFHADLKQHTPTVEAAPVTASPVDSLPVVSVQMQGSIAVVSNLTLFGDRLRAYVAEIDKNPQDDQGFANCDAAVKVLKKAEEALTTAEESALAQTASIEELRRTVGDLRELARSTRLAVEKVVKQQKEKVKADAVQEGRAALEAHIAAMNQRLGKPYMPAIHADFGGAIKGLKTLASVKDAVATALANAKIEASAAADKIDANLRTLRELASDHAFLFADASTIVHKANDDLIALVKTRIAEHAEAERVRLEAERERIRKEEVARLEREQAVKQPVQEAAEVKAEPTPTAAPSKVTPIPQRAAKRPTDAEIIQVLSQHYRVHETKVIEWLCELDLSAAETEAMKEFA